MATTSSQAAYASLQAYKPRTAEQTLGEAESKYDVGGARERVGKFRSLVGNLQSAVEAVDPSVTGRTSGTFTSEGQRQALVNRERQPILGDLAKQQGFLSEEQAELTQSQALASQMATALFNQDQQTYQKLLDQYNAATAAEHAAEQRRQFEENLRLERERLAATERAARESRTVLPNWQGGQQKQVDPLQQTGFNEAMSRINSQPDSELVSDMISTLKGNARGIPKDKYKIETYKRHAPDLFAEAERRFNANPFNRGGGEGWGLGLF